MSAHSGRPCPSRTLRQGGPHVLLSRWIRQVVVHERNSCEPDRFVESASGSVSGIATSSDVDEFKLSVAESSDGELHQGSGMTATLVLRVYGDHLDDTH